MTLSLIDMQRARIVELESALEYACGDSTPERPILSPEERLREALDYASRKRLRPPDATLTQGVPEEKPRKEDGE